MQANPGGQLDPREVIGRDALIARLWKVLRRQSVLLTAERRTGKTSVLKKMKAECPEEVLIFYRDLEGVRTPLEFVQKVVQDVDGSLSQTDRAVSRGRALLKVLGGIEVGSVLKFPEAGDQDWKTLLDATIADLVQFQHRRVLFFWDEIPLMLHTFKARFGEQAAMEVLDSLRALRQHHGQLRMVFTGSIGLHNVLSSLKRSGYANDAVNDMLTVDLPALADADARSLAARLIEGEALAPAEPARLAAHIAQAVDRLPYYIHHVVDTLTERDEKTPAMVDAIVGERLTDAQDPWHLRHYVERITTYYEGSAAHTALALLDHLAVAAAPAAFAELRNAVDAQLPDVAKQEVHDTLDLLKRDHYVVQEVEGKFTFRVPLIRRWWRLHRGL